ncbi:MAG: hypothetical protein AB8B64_25480 [Granulosicoccus sp.]
MNYSIINTSKIAHSITFFTVLSLSPTVSSAASYDKQVTISGVIETTRVSGFQGSDTTLRASKSGHAMYGISSWERSDQPCYLKLRTEDVNDADDKGSHIKDRCGAAPTSKELRAQYSDVGLNEQRIFVSGIRVCLNEKGTRVKGIQLRGKKISDIGKIVPLPVDVDISKNLEPLGYRLSPSVVTNDDSNEPYSYRLNCQNDNWKRWAECSHPIGIATGVVAHFEAGRKPRALTGIALNCQQVKSVSGRAGS